MTQQDPKEPNATGGSLTVLNPVFTPTFNCEDVYVGHAEGRGSIEIDGDIAVRDCTVRYRRGDGVVAVATIGRDRVALEQSQRLAAAA